MKSPSSCEVPANRVPEETGLAHQKNLTLSITYGSRLRSRGTSRPLLGNDASTPGKGLPLRSPRFPPGWIRRSGAMEHSALGLVRILAHPREASPRPFIPGSRTRPYDLFPADIE